MTGLLEYLLQQNENNKGYIIEDQQEFLESQLKLELCSKLFN
jgi:hypothetical protein